MLFSFLFTLLVIYLSLSVGYILFFALASKHKFVHSNRANTASVRMLFMVPAYKEDAVIVETAKNILAQPDFGVKDEVVVIADQLNEKTLLQLHELAITIIKVNLTKSTKANAINAALAILPTKYDAVVLLDADNHLVPGFIKQAKQAFSEGKRVIQAHRIAKNLDTDFAKLDAISEEINNTIFRAGHRAVGLSAALIGSGLIMDYQLYKSYMADIEVVSGFDKQLELNLLHAKQPIHYLPEAYILDEKVRKAEVFEKQRTRWIAAQFSFARKHFVGAWAALLKGNFDFFDKVMQFFLPPRVLLLGAVFFIQPIGLFWNELAPWTISLLMALLIAFYVAIPAYLRQLIDAKLLLVLPNSLFGFIKAILKNRQAKHQFIHTPHGEAVCPSL